MYLLCCNICTYFMYILYCNTYLLCYNICTYFMYILYCNTYLLCCNICTYFMYILYCNMYLLCCNICTYVLYLLHCAIYLLRKGSPLDRQMDCCHQKLPFCEIVKPETKQTIIFGFSLTRCVLIGQTKPGLLHTCIPMIW